MRGRYPQGICRPETAFSSLGTAICDNSNGSLGSFSLALFGAIARIFAAWAARRRLSVEREIDMKAIIDADTCTGCGLCSDTCPEVFAEDDDAAKVIADPIPADAEESAKEAADDCPVEAIKIEE